MAVVKATIKTALNSLYDDMGIGNGLTKDQCADRMADIIRDAIQSGDVQSGITCSVDPVTHNGLTTGTGTIA